MQKNHRLIVQVLSAGAVAVLLAFVIAPGPDKGGIADIPGVENPGKRAEWELLRLRDPKTGRIPEGIRMRELAFANRIPTKDQVLAKSPALAKTLAADWHQRGPYNVGGRTRALAVDLDNENIMLAGGASGGMWRSTSAGARWNRSTHPMQHPTVSCLVQDPRIGKRHVWYYGTGEYHGSSASVGDARFSGEGVFKSTDGGVSWRQLPSTVMGNIGDLDSPFDYVWNIVVDRSNQEQDEVYAAVHNGILRSSDGGASWEYVLGSTDNRSTFTDVAITDNGVLYASLSSQGNVRGLWRSEDGIAWTNITPGGWPFSYNRIVIGIAPSDPNVVYFLGETPNAGRQVGGGGIPEWHSIWKYTYKSGDGAGARGTWQDRSLNLPGASGQFGGFRSQRSYDLVIKVKPDNENIVFIGGTNLYRSTDGFATSVNVEQVGGYKDSVIWMDFSYPGHHPDQHSMFFLPSNPSVLLSGHDGGISRTSDCMADSVGWQSLNNGYLTTQLYALAIDQGTPGDPTIVIGMQDNSSWLSRIDDVETPWALVGPGDGAFCAIADGGSAYYVSSQGGRVYRIGFDLSGEFQGFARIDPIGGPGYLFINPFAMDPTDNRLLYHLSGGYIWRNSDPTTIPLDQSNEAKSKNWKRLNSVSATNILTAVGVSTANPSHRVYAGAVDGGIYGLDNAHAAGSGLLELGASNLPEAYVSCIAVDPKDGSRALAVYSNYGVPSLFYTSNAGASWVDVSGNLEENPDGSGDGPSCRWATFLNYGGESIIYVGTSTGLYSATNLNGQGTVWMQEGENTIGKAVVNMVTARQSDGYVVVGTHGNGVFTATLGSSSVHSRDEVAGGLQLLGAAPNPMREATTIRFTLPSSGNARLTLFDATGRQVHTMLDRHLPAGSHEIPLRARDLPSPLPNGTYYCRLEYGGEQKTGAVTVMK